MPEPGSNEYSPVIGLEVHAQLLTATKMFCACKAEYGVVPNSRTCPVCLGYPGALPTINRRAVEHAVMMILAVGGQVQHRSLFARKNYFYPDLPKGYQISQYDRPIGIGGKVSIDLGGRVKDVHLSRIHLEEDAGKLLHPESGEDYSRIDFNRCGVPLLEIVTEPQIESPQEAHAFLDRLRQIVQYLGICSGDMEKGALRCDANVSLRRGRNVVGVRTELKNLNSFRAVQRALEYEVERQGIILSSGGDVIQETRLWNESTAATEPMRGKEESEDYRYFPEPDLPSLQIDPHWVEEIGKRLPPLPEERRMRLMHDYGLSEYDAGILTESKSLADYYESVASLASDKRLAAHWVMGEILAAVKTQKADMSDFNVTPEMLAELLASIESGIITGTMAKEIFQEMVDTGRRATVIIRAKGLRQVADEGSLAATVDEVLSHYQDQVEKYRAGKGTVFDFFVGRVMAKTEGRANPQVVRRILKEKLDGR